MTKEELDKLCSELFENHIEFMMDKNLIWSRHSYETGFENCRAILEKEIEALEIDLWQAKGELGYPVPSHIPENKKYKCGLCEARAEEIERLKATNPEPIIKEAKSSVSNSVIAQINEALNLFVISSKTTQHGVYRLIINEQGMQLDKVE